MCSGNLYGRLAVGGALLVAGLTASLSPARADEPGTAPSVNDLGVELARHQLVPEILCVVGLTSSQVTALVEHASSEVANRWEGLLADRARLVAARAEVTRLQMLIDGPGGDQHQAAYAAAVAELAVAETSLAAMESQLRDALDAGLGPDAAALMARLRSNQERGMPIEYLGLELPDERWMELRGAYAEIITVQDPDEPDPATVQIFNIYDGDPVVTAARTRIRIRGDEVRAAFMTSLAGQG